MSEASPIIDSLEFARSGQMLEGSVRVAQLARLAEGIFDTEGKFEYRLEGGLDARQRPRIRLYVKGEVHLECQRCLGRIVHAVDVDSRLLVLTPSEGAATEDVEDLDGVPADAHTEAWKLVEDEVLLAIPYAARHPEADCSPPGQRSATVIPLPFAALDKLRRP